jgi:hypothetical protein
MRSTPGAAGKTFRAFAILLRAESPVVCHRCKPRATHALRPVLHAPQKACRPTSSRQNTGARWNTEVLQSAKSSPSRIASTSSILLAIVLNSTAVANFTADKGAVCALFEKLRVEVHCAFSRELDGVAAKVQQHLSESIGISNDRERYRRIDRNDDFQPSSSCLNRE